ncbi:hypothetical protein [Melittangium boletus]|uniref:hypothetical protein n=1 Tax=Melittangium boletus TaxID=83453 RepID=UPI003DA58091
MSALLIRLVCGLLFLALVLGAVAHPPQDMSQGLGMLLPGGMLLGYAVRGPRRSLLPKRKSPPAPIAPGT